MKRSQSQHQMKSCNSKQNNTAPKKQKNTNTRMKPLHIRALNKNWVFTNMKDLKVFLQAVMGLTNNQMNNFRIQLAKNNIKTMPPVY